MSRRLLRYIHNNFFSTHLQHDNHDNVRGNLPRTSTDYSTPRLWDEVFGRLRRSCRRAPADEAAGGASRELRAVQCGDCRRSWVSVSNVSRGPDGFRLATVSEGLMSRRSVVGVSLMQTF